MLSFRDITLEDKGLIEDYVKRANIQLSNYGFANMWMWHHWYRMEVALEGGTLFIRYGDPFREGGPFMSCPIAPDEEIGEALDTALCYQCEHGLVPAIHSVPEDIMKRAMAQKPGRFVANEDEAMDDYVYAREVLSTLSGKKMHGKRNHVNRFKAEYPDFIYRALTPMDVEECVDMHHAWWEERDFAPEYAPERVTIKRAIDHMEDLEMRGGGIWIDGQLVAFTLASLLPGSMADVNIEKALSGYNGLYSAINQQFAQHALHDLEWVNREEDMGIEGLRAAKRSYRPAFMLRKYTLTLAP